MTSVQDDFTKTHEVSITLTVSEWAALASGAVVLDMKSDTDGIPLEAKILKAIELDAKLLKILKGD